MKVWVFTENFKMYSVVEFTGQDREVAVVAGSWLFLADDDVLNTYWPPVKDPIKLSRAVENCVPVVKENWKSFECKLLYSTGMHFSDMITTLYAMQTYLSIFLLHFCLLICKICEILSNN